MLIAATCVIAASVYKVPPVGKLLNVKLLIVPSGSLAASVIGMPATASSRPVALAAATVGLPEFTTLMVVVAAVLDSAPSLTITVTVRETAVFEVVAKLTALRAACHCARVAVPPAEVYVINPVPEL